MLLKRINAFVWSSEALLLLAKKMNCEVTRSRISNKNSNLHFLNKKKNLLKCLWRPKTVTWMNWNMWVLLSSLMMSLNENELTKQRQKLSFLYLGPVKFTKFVTTEKPRQWKNISCRFPADCRTFHWTFNDLYYLTVP